MEGDLKPPAKFSFADPNTALRFAQLLDEYTDDRVKSGTTTDRYGYVLDITQDGPEFPSANLEYVISTDISGNPINPQAVNNTLDNPVRASYAKVLTDDGFIIRARISPEHTPVFRKAEFFDKANPSGEGVMIDERGVYITVIRANGVSYIDPVGYPWLVQVPGGTPGDMMTVEPQVAPRVHVSGKAGQYYVVNMMRGATRAVLDLEAAKQEILETIQELTQAKADIEQAKTDITTTQAQLELAEQDILTSESNITQALQDAATAKSDAEAALEAAGDAMLGANSSNAIIQSLADASGTTHPTTGADLKSGDWWQKWDNATDRNIIGLWRWNGTTWQPQGFSHEVLASLDVNRLVVNGAAKIALAVVEKIIGDAAFYNVLTTDKLYAGVGEINSLVAQQFATALASIIEARIENLTVTENASMNSAVILKLATEIVTSGEFKTLINQATGVYAVMDNSGFKVVDTDGPDGMGSPESIIKLGPDLEKLLQLGTGLNMVSVNSSGGLSARLVDTQQLVVAGRPIAAVIGDGPRGVVSRGTMEGVSRWCGSTPLRLISIDTYLENGRVYKISSTGATIITDGPEVSPVMYLSFSQDGSNPESNIVGNAWSESYIGPYDGMRTLPPMMTWLDLRGRALGGTTRIRALTALMAGDTETGECYMDSNVNNHHIWIEDWGVEFHNNGSPYYAASQPAVKIRDVVKWNATGWATYLANGTKDTVVTNPIQGQAGGQLRKCLYIFPSLTTALSDATINRITCYAYAAHWGDVDGGTGSWAWHGHGTVPASSPTLTFMKDEAGWPRGAVRQINIPPADFAAWKNGTRKGFGFTTANTTSEYYGNFSPDLNSAYIEIDFEK